MWTSHAERNRKRRCTSATLEQLVQERKRRLETERAEAPALRERAVAIRADAEALVARFQVRMKRDAIARADELEREASVRESMMREAEFDALAERYLTHHARHPEDEAPPCEIEDKRIITAPGCTKHETIDGYVQRARQRECTKSMITQEYISDVEQGASRLCIRARDECPFCKQDLFLNTVKSVLVCTTCGYGVVHFDSTISSMSYSDEYEFSSFSYKRISHFEDCMKQVQGKESFVVPDSILNAVMQHLLSLRLQKQDITQMKVRDALKTLRLRRAYDHVAQVYTRISGKRAPRVSADVEETCRQMFMRMQPIFEKHCPKTRKNFLSYHYVLFRIFHILGLEYMLVGFSLLKGPDKLRLQDVIFEKIAADLDWPFEPVEQIMERVRQRKE